MKRDNRARVHLQSPQAKSLDVKLHQQSLQVFLRIPQMNRTVPATITGAETGPELRSKVQNLMSMPSPTASKLNLVSEGRPLTDASHLKANATIVVTCPGLLGGSIKAGADTDANGNVFCENPAYSWNIADKPITFGKLKEQFEEGFPKNKEKNWSFTYEIGDKIVNEEEDENVNDQTLEKLGLKYDDPLLKLILVTVVAGADKGQADSGDVKFMKKIPYFNKAQPRNKFLSKITEAQRTLMIEFENKEMQRENLDQVLKVMNDRQMDDILISFIKSHPDVLLTYLLKKANQWTSLSKDMTAKASLKLKAQQIRRLISKLENQYDPDDENDKIIAGLLHKDQERVLGPIIDHMSEMQPVELLMLWMTPEQRPDVILSLEQGDVRHFWNKLSKERRMGIFSLLPQVQQFEAIVTDKYLDEDQKRRLWDNMDKHNRIEIWNSTQNVDLVEKFFEVQVKTNKIISAAVSSLGGAMTNNLFGALGLQEDQEKKNTNIQAKSKELKQKLLISLTRIQQANLWSILPRDQQRVLLDLIVTKVEDGIDFFSELPHDSRKIMIDQLLDEDVKKIFLAMNKFQQAELMYMLNKENQIMLKKDLTPEQERALFFHGHFKLEEKTSDSHQDYCNNLIDEFYKQNNQIVPFDQKAGGFVQVIKNPHKSNGWIAVQIIEPSYAVDNTDYEFKEDPLERELYSDEAHAFDADKKERNDTFRFTQNHYGQIKEVEPNPARNKKVTQQFATISFFEYSKKKGGMWCTHSFFAPNPVIYSAGDKSKSPQEMVLFTGQNNDVFFFSKTNTTDKFEVQSDCSKKKFDLCAQVIRREQNPNKGEQSRESFESCYEYRIPQQSKLYDLLIHGRFEMYNFTEVHLLNALPTMIQEDQKSYIVFSHCEKDAIEKLQETPSDIDENFKGAESGPSLYFYDLVQQKEVMRIQGGEALISYKYNNDLEGKLPDTRKDQLMFLGNKEIMSYDSWEYYEGSVHRHGRKIEKKKDATIYTKSAIPERNTAIVVSLRLRISEEPYELWSSQDSAGRLIKRPTQWEDIKKFTQDTVPDKEMSEWIPRKEDLPQSFSGREPVVSVLDLKDEDQVFQQRYLRNSLLQIQPHTDQETKEISAFTLLFREIYAFTFQHIMSLGVMDAETKAKCQTKVDKLTAEIKQMKASDKENKQVKEIAAKKEKKRNIFADKTPKLNYFRCKYIVPQASEIILSNRDKKDVKTLVQVSNESEHAKMMARENLKTVNEFDIHVYDISNTKLKHNDTERLPGGLAGASHEIKVPMSKKVLRNYATNQPPNKFGEYNIKVVMLPALFLRTGVVGGFLNMAQTENVTKGMIEWYIKPKNETQIDKSRIVKPSIQYHTTDYPLLAYKGYVPDNREIVLVNLADKMDPQKIIHLVDMQLICFVGHNFASRNAMIGMLCLQDDKFKLCWLVCQQPYKKRLMNEYDQMQIIQADIEFNCPIIQSLADIKRVEYVNLQNKSIGECGEGALVIQTGEDLWYSSNQTGYYRNLTEGKQSQVTLQRGFNSYFYYALQSNESDVIVNELKLHYVNQDWNPQIQEVLKVNEAKIISIEMDPENRSKTDSVYQFDYTLIEEREEATNMLFIVDDKENMWKMRQKTEDENGARYEILQETNIEINKDFTQQISEYKKQPFNRMSISDRSISFNDSNWSFANGHKWPLNLRRPAIDDVVEAVQTEENEREMAGIKRPFKKVKTIENIVWTSRQLLKCYYQDYNPKQDRFRESFAFITKLQPSTRRQDLIGMRGVRDLSTITGISSDKFLMHFAGQHANGNDDYYSIIDKHGQIHPISKKIQEHLVWSNWISGESREQRRGSTVVMCGGQQKVLSLETDVAYFEKNVTSIDFNRQGEVMSIVKFDKEIYEDALKKQIRKQLLTEHEKIFGKDFTMTPEKAVDVAEGLETSQKILVTKTGDLYRIATVMHPQFSDDVAINPYQDEDKKVDDDAEKKKGGKEEKKPDLLNMGIFVVKQKEQQECLNLSKLSKTQKTLKIVLFLCKSQKDRNHINNAGFVIVGNHLCWSFPAESTVHVLEMDGMNETENKIFPSASSMIKSLHDLPKSLFGSSASNQTQQQKANVYDDDDDGFTRAEDSPRRSTRSPRKLRLNDSSDDSEDDVESGGRSLVTLPDKEVEDSYVKATSLLSNQVNMTKASGLFSNLNKRSSLLQLENKHGMDTEIHWKNIQTRTIDLNIMCETEQDKTTMHLLELPKCPQFSVRVANKDLGEKENQPQIRENLLQVTVRDRIIVFALAKEKEPQEIFFLNATSQFIQPQSNVHAGVKMVNCYEDTSGARNVHVIQYINSNQSKDLNVLLEKRLIDKKSFGLVELSKQRTQKMQDLLADEVRPSFVKGFFNNYAEQDLVELIRISDKCSGTAKLDNIDFQTLLSSFKYGHTTFSIFYDQVKFFEQVLTQIQEGEFPVEVQEDETELENGLLRRLYRILNLPVPDMATNEENETKKNEKKDKKDKKDKKEKKKDISDSPAEPNEQAHNDPTNDKIHESQTVVVQDVQKEQEKNPKLKEQEKKTKQGLRSVLQKGIYHKQPRIKDCLLFIANQCGECQISTFCENQKDFGNILKNLNSSALELINESFVSNIFTSRIMNTNWASEESMITFTQSSSRISQEEIDDILKKQLSADYEEGDIQKQQVDVRILDISWMLKDRMNFVNFTGTLDEASNDDIYETEFISALLKEFWDQNFDIILWKCFIPWCGYAFCAMFFFVQALAEDHNPLWCNILGLLTLVLLSWQMIIEIRQFRAIDSGWDYFKDFQNLQDQFQVLTTIAIIVAYMTNITSPSVLSSLRVLAAISTLCIWIKVLDWCKLFSGTAFFIRLIADTLKDIQAFTIIFIVALMMFGMPMYILQLNRSEDNAIVDEVFGNIWILNAFYNQYMLSLGEFAIDNFAEGPQVYICYAFFLVATFLTQLTFLNMLIAIMGDTYAMVMESKEKYALLTQREILSDYSALILTKNQKQDENNYLFVVTPKMEGGEGAGAWEGNLTVIKRCVENGLGKMQKQLDKKLLAVTSVLGESKTRDMRFEKESRGQYLRITEKFSALEKRFDEVKPETTEKIFNIVQKSQQELKYNTEQIKNQNEKFNDENQKLLTQSVNKSYELLNLTRENNTEVQTEIKKLKQGGNNNPAEDQQAQPNESIETKTLLEAGAVAQEKANEALEKLTEQQANMMKQVKQMNARQNTLEATLSSNQSAQTQLQEQVQSTQTTMMGELQALRDDVRQVQQSASPGVDLASIQGLMQQFTEQMTSQQQQMQQDIQEQQRTDKEAIMGMLEKSAAEDDEDDEDDE